MDRRTEIDLKLDRVRQLLEQKKLNGILLSTNANFAWVTAGGDNHVEIANKSGVASVYVTPESKFVITNNIEAPRIEQEELSGLGFEILVSEWYDPAGNSRILERLTSGRKCAADHNRPGMIFLGEDIAQLRYQLTPPEIARYRWLGVHSSLAVEKAARSVVPGMSEHQIAAEIARNLMSENMIPAVILVACDERVYEYRHPIPTEKKVDKYAMLVACARRWGLVTSRTRSVYFGELPSDLEARQRAVAQVDAAFIAHTRTGAAVVDIFSAAQRAYTDAGFGDEWRYHHQGGAAGYEPRDSIVTPNSRDVVLESQAFAWNPTIAGAKSEDTIIAHDGPPEIITLTGDWPTLGIESNGVHFERPAILVR